MAKIYEYQRKENAQTGEANGNGIYMTHQALRGWNKIYDSKHNAHRTYLNGIIAHRDALFATDGTRMLVQHVKGINPLMKDDDKGLLIPMAAIDMAIKMKAVLFADFDAKVCTVASANIPMEEAGLSRHSLTRVMPAYESKLKVDYDDDIYDAVDTLVFTQQLVALNGVEKAMGFNSSLHIHRLDRSKIAFRWFEEEDFFGVIMLARFENKDIEQSLEHLNASYSNLGMKMHPGK